MKRKYKRRVKRSYDRNRLGVQFGGEVTLLSFVLTRVTDVYEKQVQFEWEFSSWALSEWELSIEHFF